MTKHIGFSIHATKQLTERGLIPLNCPFREMREIVYEHIKNAKPYRTNRSIIYIANEYEFVFANDKPELITFIVNEKAS